jgi:hypothetical protein
VGSRAIQVCPIPVRCRQLRAERWNSPHPQRGRKGSYHGLPSWAHESSTPTERAARHGLRRCSMRPYWELLEHPGYRLPGRPARLLLGILPAAPSPQHIIDCASPGKPQVSMPLYSDPLPHTSLVGQILKSCDHTGGLIRKEPGAATKPHKGRRSLTPSWWRWRTLVATKWKSGLNDHINRLELRSILTAIRWRTRNKDRLNRRALHLTDSAVSMGAVSKCRPPSRALQPVLDRISALLLAGRIRLELAHVSTHENPADGPSRGRLAAKPSSKKQRHLFQGLASPKLAGAP